MLGWDYGRIVHEDIGINCYAGRVNGDLDITREAMFAHNDRASWAHSLGIY